MKPTKPPVVAYRSGTSASALYAPSGSGHIFAWLHQNSTNHRTIGVVICGTVGYEAVPSHRTLRHLAIKLSEQGFPCIRFDYRGTGDASGTLLETDPSTWIEDAQAAAAALQERCGVESVIFVGLRLGALVALQASSDPTTSGVVLWGAMDSGRKFVREWQAMARLGTFSDRAQDDGLSEAGGFGLTTEQLDTISSWPGDLDHLSSETPVFAVHRDDLPPAGKLMGLLDNGTREIEQTSPADFAGVIDEPHYTRVPDGAIDDIAAWVARMDGNPARPVRTSPSDSTEMWRDPARGFTERPVMFGRDRPLVGVVAQPLRQDETVPVAILMVNAGSVPRTGPNRMYTDCARDFAAAGATVLRFDVGGLGDSPAPDGSEENNPYSPWALDDIGAALDWMHEHTPATRYAAIGMCSGAYASFHVGLSHPRLHDVVLINPLTFYWEDGMSLEQPSTQHYRDLAYYKQAARNWRRWTRLLTGQADYRGIFGVVRKQAIDTIQRWVSRFRGQTDPLEHDLARLCEKADLTFVFSRGDPGHDLLFDSAGSTARRLRRKKAMRIVMIDQADHTFTGSAARRSLHETLMDVLELRPPV